MSCKIKNHSNYDITDIKPLVQDLYGFANQRFGFKKPPVINFVSDSQNHHILGKTAHYDPNTMEIWSKNYTKWQELWVQRMNTNRH